MGIYEELKARGLIAQVTDEEQIRELVKKEGLEDSVRFLGWTGRSRCVIS